MKTYVGRWYPFQKFLSRRAIYMYKYVENFVEFVLSLFFCSLSMLQEKEYRSFK